MRTTRRARASRMLVGLAVMAAVAGCGGGQPEQVAGYPPSPSGASSPVEPVSPTAEPSPSLPSEPPAPSDLPSDSIGVPSDEPSGPPVVRPAGQPRKLTLADIFEHEQWEEGVYQVPQSATPMQAMATKQTCYNGSQLEVRLAQASGTARVTVAQALDSKDSTVTLQFKLLANQRLVDTKNVRFDQTAALTARVDGVSALTLQVQAAEGSTSCSATAVVTDFRITPA